MKKALIASTALVLSAGVAAADVTISGYGRTAVDYQENRTRVITNAAGEEVILSASETQMEARVRMNIHATTSTDQGVDFGARLRVQWDQGEAGVDSISPGQVYVTASGFTVAVGNVGTAYDNAGLLYESEVGLISRSFGVSTDFDYHSYRSKSSGDFPDRLGLSVEYAVDALTARFSYIDLDQSNTGLSPVREDEFGISVDYDWNGIALSAAAVKDGLGRDGNDRYFVGAYYTLPGTENGVGLSFADDGIDSDGLSNDNIVTLWGDYTVAPLTTLSAYIANNGKAGNETDNAFGLGARYDLGGAYLAGSLERGYDENVRGDFGVRFDF